jgi:hypothetical protein
MGVHIGDEDLINLGAILGEVCPNDDIGLTKWPIKPLESGTDQVSTAPL